MREALYVHETIKDEHGNFIAFVVKEGEAGYYPTNRTLGENIDKAFEFVHDYNRKFYKLEPNESEYLFLQSLFPDGNKEMMKELNKITW